jgi:hypothetical protein
LFNLNYNLFFKMFNSKYFYHWNIRQKNGMFVSLFLPFQMLHKVQKINKINYLTICKEMGLSSSSTHQHNTQ